MIERRRFLTGSATALAGLALASHVRAADPLPAEIIGVRIPDSAIAKAAVEQVRSEVPDFLFNHSMRIFVWGSRAASLMGGVTFDPELAFVASAFHDIGLIEAHELEGVSFEWAGAAYARQWCLDNGIAEDDARKIFDAIAMHASGGTGGAVPEATLVQGGALIDVFGGSPTIFNQLKPDIPAVLDVLPRLDFNRRFVELGVAHIARNPHPAGEFGWLARHVARFPNGGKIGEWES